MNGCFVFLLFFPSRYRLGIARVKEWLIAQRTNPFDQNSIAKATRSAAFSAAISIRARARAIDHKLLSEQTKTMLVLGARTNLWIVCATPLGYVTKLHKKTKAKSFMRYRRHRHHCRGHRFHCWEKTKGKLAYLFVSLPTLLPPSTTHATHTHTHSPHQPRPI